MKTSDFNYELPKEFIAQKPVTPRDSAKLMVLHKEKIEHKQFSDIIDYLNKDDVLVINETKVTPAKLIGKKPTGGIVEILIVEKIKDTEYKVLMKAQKENSVIQFPHNLTATVTKRDGYYTTLKFSIQDISPYCEKYGSMPVPPYISGKDFKQEQYQTQYAKEVGSIAAPTAGLHFTKELLVHIKQKGINIVPICLHVGLGTFSPVKVDDIKDHVMHTEQYSIPKETADKINNRKGKLFVVGTTTMRTLEAATENGKVFAKKDSTDIFIYPGYPFKNKVDGFITNFHLPESTLLMLVATFCGKEKILQAYEQAKKNNYRFYSFGDAMLILK